VSILCLSVCSLCPPLFSTVSFGALSVLSIPSVLSRPPPHNVPLSYYGHGGDTYGYMSDSGYFPLLQGSISVIVNQDSDYIYPSYVVTCNIAKFVMERLKMDTSKQWTHKWVLHTVN
jgi:hypothetical protein